MIKKWMLLYWFNYFFMAGNVIVFSASFISVDSWFVMPCVIVSFMSMAPIFFSCIWWSVIKSADVNHLYMNKLFARKFFASILFVLLIFAWSWWGGGMAIFAGSVIGSWMGGIIFWTVGKYDLDYVLSSSKNVIINSSRGINSFSSDNNPALGLSIIGDAYIKSNFYDPPIRAQENYFNSDVHVSNGYHYCGGNGCINPASGIPMLSSFFDAQGNVYGANSSNYKD